MIAGIAKSFVPGPVKRRMKSFHRWGKDVLSRSFSAKPRLYNLSTAERVGVVFTAPTDMSVPERLFLYSLVRGCEPQRVLEIGVAEGGSGCIIANALEDNGKGRIVGIDPEPAVKVPAADLHGRYTFLQGLSPEAIEPARKILDGPFDLVLIDGLHTCTAVTNDLEAVLPHMVDGGYILFHDAFHYGIFSAVQQALASHDSLHDAGLVCRSANLQSDPWTPYRGLRLVQVRSKSWEELNYHRSVYRAAGKPIPAFGPDIADHDAWYCRAIQPCPRCRQVKG